MTNIEKKAPVVAMSVALFLALIKFIVWIISGSVALLSSAMDSLLDTWVSIFNYFAIKFSWKKADKDHNYWHWKIEGIAATIEWTIITLSGFYIIYEWINKILNPEPISYINWTLVVMWISILATWWLVYFLNYVYKKTNNLVIKWDSIHYKMDLYTNLAVIITLWIVYIFPSFSWIDGIVWLLIGFYIIHEAWELIKEWIDLLLDKALDEHEKVKEIIESFIKNKKFDSYHCLKTRAWWSKDKFVEFHFVMDPKTTILEAHDLWEEIEEQIKKLDKEINRHVVWHVDPFDDSKTNWCK
jgi:cation diffusion facilitator family transporter